MRRYWIPQENLKDGWVRIEGESFHHICGVCRQGVGDRFEILTGDGQVHLIEVVDIKSKKAQGKILETRTLEPLKEPYLHLVLSVPKFPVLESVLQKSVELGVHTVHLATTDFSFIKKRSVLEQKWPRWKKIIQGASQQSARPTLMGLEFVGDVQNLLTEINRNPGKAGLLFYEGEGQTPLRSALGGLKEKTPREVYFFVGSEGGFSAQEVQLFSSLGFPPVSLGPQVLRVETACVSIASVLKYELDA